MKLHSFGRNVMVFVPDKLMIDGIYIRNEGERRFGKVCSDSVVRDETGKEYKLKEGTWIIIGGSRRVEIGEDLYLGVEVDEILGIVEGEIKEDFVWGEKK